MSRKQQLVIEYLLEENRILKEQFDSTGKKLRLTNRHRRELAKKGKLLGWKQLVEYASIAQPDTIYAWHRKLVALKYTAKRKINTEKQKRMAVIRELCVKYATENLLQILSGREISIYCNHESDSRYPDHSHRRRRLAFQVHCRL